MPRPRRDSEILPAKERLENAFWELLNEREYHKITVTDIVREAHVNRNSFYYHFSSLSELADSAILREVEKTSFTRLTESINSDNSDDNDEQHDKIRKRWRKHMTQMLDSPDECEHVNRLALIAGPHSAPELIESLHDFGRLSLINTLQIDADHMDLKTDLTIEFAVGGMLTILRRWPELRTRFTPDDLAEDDLTALAMGLYMSMSKHDLRDYWNSIFHSGNLRNLGKNSSTQTASAQ